MEDTEDLDDIEALRAQLASACPREDIDLFAVERVLKDAERYRKLRSGNYSIALARSILNDTPHGIDAAVDALPDD